MSARRWLPRLSLRGWLLLSYLTVFVLPPLALVMSGALDRDLRQQTRASITDQAHLWALTLEHELESGPALPQRAADLSKRLARARDRTLTGIQIVDAAGIVVASSGERTGQDLGQAPEVRQALEGAVGW
ncbi:MAG: hypothetical protein KDK70_40285, partial [Myxococcales bacterium]|nr:hypothetical protein [Myxococcales bacterium]